MQLDKKNASQVLALATSALLGTGVQAAEEPVVNESTWSFDSALMVYSETDRVSAFEGILSATKDFGDTKLLNLKLTADSLTGASATGAVAQPTVQSFTRPSGEGNYNVEASELPLDDTFRDTRVQFNGQWTQPLGNDYTGSVGGYFSKEYDYLSLGVNGSVARDFYNKNTTLSAGFSFAHDVLNPVGGVSEPLTPILPSAQSYMEGQDYRLNALGDEETKDTVDVLFGITQVINRRMLVQLNYSFSSVDGYQNDPYKLVSQVDDSGIVQQNLYESRPNERTKQSLFAQTKYHFEESILDFSYRYMWDDWGINSNTFDIRYRMPISSGYLEPHVRYYQQEAADFYEPFIYGSDTLPEHVSADYRVGDLNGITVGLKYGFPLENGDEMSFRLEFFQQTPNNPGVELPTELESLPMFEKIQAVVLQVNYSF